MGIQELLARRPRPAPKQEINVVGGVLVYCDPKTWPENPEKLNLPEGWFVAVGSFAPSLQSIPTSPKAATAGESNSLDRRSK
jgi:hypothetical protein